MATKRELDEDAAVEKISASEIGSTNTSNAKKQKLECVVCMGRCSLVIDNCPGGCTFHVCHDCFFKVCEVFRKGVSMNDVRYKCLYCRRKVPIGNMLWDILRKRKSFRVSLRHTSPISKQQYELFKREDGSVGLAIVAHLREPNGDIINFMHSQLSNLA